MDGHKTGHYLDQCREPTPGCSLRARRAKVMDAFSYDGLFGIRAALAGAEDVGAVSGPVRVTVGERVMRNAERNGVAHKRDASSEANVDARPQASRRARERRYGLVVVDPPASARNRREAQGAARGYRELNQRAMEITEPGGVLVTASCSYNVQRASEFLTNTSPQASFLRPAARRACFEHDRGSSRPLGPPDPARERLPQVRLREALIHARSRQRRVSREMPEGSDDGHAARAPRAATAGPARRGGTQPRAGAARSATPRPCSREGDRIEVVTLVGGG